MDKKNVTNVKILISYTEYDRLKKIEEQFLEFQSKNLNSLEGKQTVNADLQDGQGSSSNIEDSKLAHLASLVAKRLSEGQPTATSSSSYYPMNFWQSSSNLIPPVAEPENVSKTPDLPYAAKILKDDLNDDFDEKQLLHLVPRSKRQNAVYLLDQFDKRGHELTWNSSGILFIDQTAIPNSNIFILFPLLFKRAKSSLPGFADFVNKINEMGLGSYIVQKQKNIKVHKIDQNTDDEKNIPWWYIGD